MVARENGTMIPTVRVGNNPDQRYDYDDYDVSKRFLPICLLPSVPKYGTAFERV